MRCRDVLIEVWSDVVCPWCFIGKRRLEAALARFPHAADVELVWRSFQLDPGAIEGETHATLPALAAKYGRSVAEMRAGLVHVEQTAAAEGLHYDLSDAVGGNTLLAHQLLHLAAERGLGAAAEELLFSAYFEQGRSLFDLDALTELGTELGLDATDVRAALTDGRYLPAVHEDIATARALGATGVPFFVVDRAFGASGAQPADVLLQLITRAWTASHPLVTVPPAAGCADDSCTV